MALAPRPRLTRGFSADGMNIIDRLASTLAHRQRITRLRPRRAAILIPILGTGDDAALLLTRRSAALSSHAGQVAFPGGVADDGETAEGTALREANEEIGLASADCTLMGLLDDLPSFKNDMTVTPVVARLSPRLSSAAQFDVNASEVARIFTIREFA